MRAMGKRTITIAAALALVACGGGGKHADSPGNCPDGTVLKGEDCVPSGDESSPSGSSGGSSKGGDDGEKPSGSSGGGGGEEPAAGGKTAYDKEAVDVQLKRASRQVKANCGTATDDEGKATGPWGSTKASVVLGRNGHVKQVTVPAPYDGKPVGICVVHAFQKSSSRPTPARATSSSTGTSRITEPKK